MHSAISEVFNLTTPEGRKALAAHRIRASQRHLNTRTARCRKLIESFKINR